MSKEIQFNELPTINKAQYRALLFDVTDKELYYEIIENLTSQGINILLTVVDQSYTYVQFKYDGRIINIHVNEHGYIHISQKYKPSAKNGTGCLLATNDLLTQGYDGYKEVFEMIKDCSLIPQCWVNTVQNYHTLKSYFNDQWNKNEPINYVIKGDVVHENH